MPGRIVRGGISGAGISCAVISHPPRAVYCDAVTEIPEHLLKRSERRAARPDSLPRVATPPAAPATHPGRRRRRQLPSTAVTPAAAPATPAEPAAPAPPAPKPDPPYVAAAKTRKKIPFWAMAALSLLPVWAFMYVRWRADRRRSSRARWASAPRSTARTSCHGATGEGGAGRPFANGEVLLTFPNIEDQCASSTPARGVQLAGVAIYGDPNRPGGPRHRGRSASCRRRATAGRWLTEAEILAVVCHERYTLGGAEPAGEIVEEFENWCSASPRPSGLEAGRAPPSTRGPGSDECAGDTFELIPIGDAPAPGSPPGE